MRTGGGARRHEGMRVRMRSWGARECAREGRKVSPKTLHSHAGLCGLMISHPETEQRVSRPGSAWRI